MALPTHPPRVEISIVYSHRTCCGRNALSAAHFTLNNGKRYLIEFKLLLVDWEMNYVYEYLLKSDIRKKPAIIDRLNELTDTRSSIVFLRSSGMYLHINASLSMYNNNPHLTAIVA